MYLINILILSFISIASTEPPVFGNPNQFNPVGSFQTSQLDFGSPGPQNGGFDYNDWIIRQTNNLYGPPGSGHNHNHNNNNGNNGNNGNGNNNNGYPHYPFFPTQRPHNTYGVPVDHNHNNGGYTYKPSSYFRVGNPKGVPTFEKPLFSPSSGLEFAATNGQIDNFNKALQEEAKQQLQQLQQYQGQGQGQEQKQTAFANGFTGFSNLDGPQQPPKSYVSVKFGQPNRHYNYQI